MKLSSEFYQLKFGALYTTHAVPETETEMRPSLNLRNPDRADARVAVDGPTLLIRWVSPTPRQPRRLGHVSHVVLRLVRADLKEWGSEQRSSHRGCRGEHRAKLRQCLSWWRCRHWRGRD